VRAEHRAFLADYRRNRPEVLADRLAATIERDNPGYRSSGLVPRQDLWDSCFDNIRSVIELLVAAVEQHGLPRGPAAEPSYDAARETGRRRAEQGLPLDDVLRSFRLGGRLIWEDVVEQISPDLDPAELREIGTRLWEIIDESSAQVAAAYHHRERDVLRAHEQRRAELWEGVLSGRANDPGFALEAARILDLPAAGDLVVVVASELEPLHAEAGLAPTSSAWVRRAGSVVGVIPVPDGPAKVLHALADLAADSAIGASPVVAGIAGVATGFRQASLAQRSLSGHPGLAAFDAVLPDAMLLSTPEVAERLVAQWLGPVLALPGGEPELLLDTLSAWVATGGSAARAAAAVHCHRNTVFNRLHRVGQLIGRDLATDAPPVELDLALRALRIRSDR